MSQKKFPPMKLEDTFRFGKHIGFRLESVIDTNIGYITWAIKEGVIQLDNEAYNHYRDVLDAA